MKKVDLNLDKELELLNQELIENEKLFTQVKTHYDLVMNSRGAGSLKFVTDQTSNVMNLRNNRIGIIKEMINIKKLKADITIKELNLNKDSNGSNDEVLNMANKLYDLMKNDNRKGNISNLLNMTNSKNNEVNSDNESNSKKEEELLHERMKNIQSKKRKAQKEKEIKERGYIFVCDMNGKVYAVNNEGTEILDDIEIPDFEITFEIDKLTGMTIAKNQYGDLLDIIEIV